MRAARPAAGPAHAACESGKPFLDSDTSRLRLLARGDPADPLVACERRDILPRSKRRWRRHERLSKVLRHRMHCAASNFFFGHVCMLPDTRAVAIQVPLVSNQY